MEKAVVLLSGGMDSLVCLALTIEAGYEACAVHLDYGQRTQAKEYDCYTSICNHYKIKNRLTVDVGHFRQIGTSSLTDNTITVSKADLDSKEIPTSYVPFRNGNILAIAASWAETLNAGALVIGAMEQDVSGYPDCRREFFDAMEQAINLGTKPETNIKILTPVIGFTKKDIVTVGTRLSVPFELTWSCYSASDEACGECDSCALRLRGFQLAGVADPLRYRIRPDYLQK